MRLTLWPSIILVAAACGPKGAPIPETAAPTVSAPPLAPAEQMVKDLAALQIDKLGNPVLRWDHIPPVVAPKERPHKLLVLLVEYPDRKFDRYKGDPEQAQKLVDFYNGELFDESYSKVDTLSHYYVNQSLGSYHVTGTVMKPITLPKNRSYYGSPHKPAGGNWRNDANAEGLVADALAVARTTFKDMDWHDFDRWDPEDIDNDKSLDESDGYLDHFIVVFAGGGQSSCEGLHKVGDVLTSNVGMEEGIKRLSKEQRNCADRIWPHRSKVKANDGRGPKVASGENTGGGIPVSDDLWIRDYNAQSEYTGASTFIHEFGHSIGLPDIYSRTSSNSTGSWEVMSGTASPSPQNMSSWSRLMLGWLKPQVILPPKFGGEATASIKLRTLDDPANVSGDSTRAAMIVLPPKEKHIELASIPEAGGKWALYSGQGNELNRKATLSADLSAVEGPVSLSFDAWWEIEPGWDFAYLEVSGDGGQSWTRRLPTDKAHMPAKHGHDGKNTLPGFTGISGDLDGDGKNESNATCDPGAELPHGEDKDGTKIPDCLVPSWVHPSFDLADMAGRSEVRVRLRYYTDGAAVMRGMLVDNVKLSGVAVAGDFEAEASAGWTMDGFSRSQGSHDLLVPHFYLVEYRDPYAKESAGHHRYDSALAKNSPLFYANPETSEMQAVQVRSAPGVVLWYYNGAYAWSENDPSINGPGNGYLLVVDSNTEELSLPGISQWLKGSAEANDTHYDVSSEAAQKALAAAYEKTVCFIRNPSYLPKTGISAKARKSCAKTPAPIGKLEFDGKPLQYSYQVYNEILPGPAREALARTGELLDTRTQKGVLSYRLRDRSLRGLHTRDAAFSAEAFSDAIIDYTVGKSGLVKSGSRDQAPVPSFDDANLRKYLNAKLRFGGAALPAVGLSLDVGSKGIDSEGNTEVTVEVRWK
ncbi:MAG: M6 family metalloprotease domain-containing protein [Myxococcales bacterium]|nr:M6 family metalloprotease domain-containing protein [Myxococcales bacterium]